jgi:DNA ligase-associated metallophosphoesterase
VSVAHPIETEPAVPAIMLAGETMLPDPSGALYWPAARTVVVADLHLEKGTNYGPHGITLPPYDTAATLAALAVVLKRLRPERVICLGDSFHDGEADERIDPADRASLADLVASHRWFWVAGNHDPKPPSLGGRVVGELSIGGLVFRHEAERAAAGGEVSGHYHPKSGYRARGRTVIGRCFVGGLDAFDPAITRLFPAGFDIHLIARGRVTKLPRN